LSQRRTPGVVLSSRIAMLATDGKALAVATNLRGNDKDGGV